MNREKPALLAAVLCGPLCLALAGRCHGDSDPLQTEIRGFSCTNERVSHAICLLAKQSPILIDVVIDDVTDPVVTVAVKKATIGEILQQLLAQYPGHYPHEQSGVILILPDRLLNKQAFPLTQRLARFSITCQSYESLLGTRQARYLYNFYLPENPEINVGLSILGLSRKPDYSSFPHVRTFENQSIVEILTAISKEERKSFYCYLLDSSFVKAQNKEWSEKKMGPTWWPNPDEPCYSVFWGTAWPGKRPSQ